MRRFSTFSGLNRQATVIRMMNHMLKTGMPMETVANAQGSPNPYFIENLQAINAEKALLILLSTIAEITGEISNIDWPSTTAFGDLISRLQGQRTGSANFILGFLNRLNLENAILIIKDFYRANFPETNLSKANLVYANLSRANLKGAHLREADLSRANLSVANLSGADLRGAKLIDADLRNANLSGANLREANLSRVNLSRADLRGADLREAVITEEQLKETKIDKTTKR